MIPPMTTVGDWKLIHAGICVQAIKKTDVEVGIVHYCTEIITDASRSISALLGVSPGASVCVHIAHEVLKECFRDLQRRRGATA